MSQGEATARSVIIEREIPHTAAKIWRALTHGALLEEWLMKNDFQPVVGHRFRFLATPMPHWNGVVDCEVLIVEPNRCLSYSWSTAGADEAGLRTIVTWTLTPTRNGVLLRLEQSGFRPEDEAAHQGARHGWQRLFTNLERVLARSS